MSGRWLHYEQCYAYSKDPNHISKCFYEKKPKVPLNIAAVRDDLASGFDPHAMMVMKQLQEAGYVAYLVGGCVRDGLLGVASKDCDVVTDASPDRIHRLFRRSLLIGKRFKIVHVRFKRHFIEVITFEGLTTASKMKMSMVHCWRMSSDEILPSMRCIGIIAVAALLIQKVG